MKNIYETMLLAYAFEAKALGWKNQGSGSDEDFSDEQKGKLETIRVKIASINTLLRSVTAKYFKIKPSWFVDWNYHYLMSAFNKIEIILKKLDDKLS